MMIREIDIDEGEAFIDCPFAVPAQSVILAKCQQMLMSFS